MHATGLQKAKEQVMTQAFMKAEGIDKDSPEYKEAMDELLAESGAPSAEDLLQSIGQARLDEMLDSTVVVERVLTYAKISEK